MSRDRGFSQFLKALLRYPDVRRARNPEKLIFTDNISVCVLAVRETSAPIGNPSPPATRLAVSSPLHEPEKRST